MAAPRQRSFLRVLLISARDVGIALAVTVVLCEAAVRILGLDPGEQMVMVDIAPEHDAGDVFWPMPKRYDPDNNAIRDEAMADPPTGATRVVLLGDSIFFGVHLEPSKRVAALLSSRFDITDLAAPGYSTVQMRIALQRHLAKPSTRDKPPDAIVFSLFHNDSAAWARTGSGVRRGCLHFRVPVPLFGGASIDPDAGWRLYRLSAAFRAVCRPFVYRDRQCREDSETRMLAEARKLHAIATAVKAQLIVVLLGDTDISWQRATRKRALLHMYNVIARDLSERGAVVIDSLPKVAELPHAEAALDTTGHLKAPAHVVVAELIADALSKGRRQLP